MKLSAIPSCAVLCVLIAGSALAQVAQPSAEQRLLAEARTGHLRQFEFLEAALIAGGMHDASSRATARRMCEVKYRSLDLVAIAQLPQEQRPAAILRGLHQHLLTGSFQPTATLVQQTLESGDYNCVTATIFYHDLCQRVGIEAEIVAQSGHVCSRLVQSKTEIETTRNDWFTNPESRPGDHLRHPITPVALIGRIYYNRALASLERKEFAQAIELLEKSLACDPRDRDAQENLLAGLNNWALALCDKRDFTAAAKRIATGLSLKTDYQPLLSNDVHVHQQWVSHLCREHEYEQALQVLDAGKLRRPAVPLFSNGHRAVYESWLKYCTERGDSAAAAQVLQRAREQLGPQVKLSLEARPQLKVISAKNRHEANQP